MASKPPRIQPMEQPGNKKLVGTVGAGAAALLIGLVATWEGKANDPYRDIVGVMTVCYGETRVQMKHYSDAQCADMLANGLNDFAKPVLTRNPELAGHPNQIAAATSLAYNVGTANYRNSTVARLFSAGRWRQACDGFLAWSYAGGKQVKGLLNRRKAERDICFRGLP